MLYILFGRDHIGKKSVRDYICKNYGLAIIPKYSDDHSKSWKLYDYDKKKYIDRTFILPEELGDIRKLKENVEMHSNSELYICDEHDPYVRWLSEKVKASIETYSYELEKEHCGNRYLAKYYIRKDDIEIALSDTDHNYCLVCVSGDVIESIKKYAENLSLQNRVSIVLIEGDLIEARDRADWAYGAQIIGRGNSKVLGVYLFEKSHEFLGVIRNTHYKIGNSVDDEKFGENISRQWEKITKMLPLKPNIFMVRPFTNKSESSKYNMNDLVEKNIFDKIKVIDYNKCFNILELDSSAASSIFEAIEKVICRSHIVIVDLRGHRNNCYYEYGYAMGLLKSSYNQKSIFCMLGAEVPKEVPFENVLSDNSRKVYSDLFGEIESEKAYDVLGYQHYKYLCKKDYDEDESLCANVIFFKDTNKDKDFWDDLTKIIKKVNQDNNFDITYLAKRGSKK